MFSIGDEYRYPDDKLFNTDVYDHPHSDIYARNDKTTGAHVHVQLNF